MTRENQFFTVTATDTILMVTLLLSSQQTLVEGFLDDVHNTALRLVHEEGFVPVGVPLVVVSPADYTDVMKGVTTDVKSLKDLYMDNQILMGNVVKVTVEYAEWAG